MIEKTLVTDGHQVLRFGGSAMHTPAIGGVTVYLPDGTMWCYKGWANDIAGRVFVQLFLDVCGAVRFRTQHRIVFKSGVIVESEEASWLSGNTTHRLPEPDNNMGEQLMRRMGVIKTAPKELVIEGDRVTLAQLCDQMHIDPRHARSKLRSSLKVKPGSWEWGSDDPQLTEVQNILSRL